MSSMAAIEAIQTKTLLLPNGYFFGLICVSQQMMSHTSVQPHTSSTLIAIPQTLHEYFAPFLILPVEAFFLTGFFTVLTAMSEITSSFKDLFTHSCINLSKV